ncbi:MAG: response regulator [Acidimicrobiales bacterium]
MGDVGRPLRVMLVDDDDKLRNLLRSVLSDDGFEIAADVGDSAGALRALTTSDPDVVVIDYTLPDGDGLRLADEIRSSRPSQPIIVFSSLFDPSLRRRAEDRGYRYVEKVDGLEVLEEAIRTAGAAPMDSGFEEAGPG